ncbi:FixH family protein [Paracoccus sp. (in: a-proteobacteria)]|uniref:FixH family protein n=1 Tax=Paracoccus sp. TaxID=267 RepID=UPI0026E0F33E|nr:FixH family protein [Paracoccus sp. (in: a-proteobacteria)]MDO5647297.1 FixH family protein [Paracoccus sp. (in: a-proteobacteria)]
MARELTGKHVLVITVGAFAVIIAVNLVMATVAIRTFPGVETTSSYIASQQFDRDRAAQEALGWTSGVDYADGVLTVTLRNAQDRPVTPDALSVLVRRPTHQRDDHAPDLRPEGAGRWVAELPLDPGDWNVDLSATAADGTAFRQRLSLVLKPGA